jgi:hypothetical protein
MQSHQQKIHTIRLPEFPHVQTIDSTPAWSKPKYWRMRRRQRSPDNIQELCSNAPWRCMHREINHRSRIRLVCQTRKCILAKKKSFRVGGALIERHTPRRCRRSKGFLTTLQLAVRGKALSPVGNSEPALPVLYENRVCHATEEVLLHVPDALVSHAVLILMNTWPLLYGNRISKQRNLKEPSLGLLKYSTMQIA